MFEILRKGMTEKRILIRGGLVILSSLGSFPTHQNLQFKVTTQDSKKPEENDRLLRIAFN
jgi:hypothetical protein